MLAVNIANIGHRPTTITTINLTATDWRRPFKPACFVPVPVSSTGNLPFPLEPGAVYVATFDKEAVEKATDGLCKLRVVVHVVGGKKSVGVARDRVRT